MLCLCCQLPTQSKLACCNDCWEALPHSNDSGSAFRYDTPIDFFITQLKFKNKLIFAHWLGEWFIKTCPLANLPQALLPVPLHKQRLRERGFNQALEISKPIGHHFKLPILRQHVVRQKATKPQSELSHSQRAKNIKNAFKLKKPMNYKHIAIVDDVITTGATANVLSQCLITSGVEKVDVWTIARVTGSGP